MQKNTFETIEIKEIQLIEDTLTVYSTVHLIIIYVLAGKGISTYDTQDVSFKKGKLYVIPFNTKYQFYSQECQLLIVECPQTFIDQIRMEADRIETCDNISKLAYITHNYHAKAGCVFYTKEDGVFAEQLLQHIQREYQNLTQDFLIIRQSISILINLIARNLIQHDYDSAQNSKKSKNIMKIITYIQKNINNREKLTIEKLAVEFNISKNYLGEYFKKNVGLSLQDYILDYKLKLVEIRLKHSTMRLKEIAYELGFNDESHLSKLFKKHKQLSPTQYRNAYRML